MITEPRTGGVAVVVERILAESSELTLAALTARLPRDPRLAGFYDVVAEYPRRARKGIRPALCLTACRAHGGSTADALGAATAIELLHSAFLVHDDICDGALRRRGGEALHVTHGVPLALTAATRSGGWRWSRCSTASSTSARGSRSTCSQSSST